MEEAEAQYKPFCTDLTDAIFSSTRWKFKCVVVDACRCIQRRDFARSYKTVKRTVTIGPTFYYYCSEDEATQVEDRNGKPTGGRGQGATRRTLYPRHSNLFINVNVHAAASGSPSVTRSTIATPTSTSASRRSTEMRLRVG
jgi:hypothetical protein